MPVYRVYQIDKKGHILGPAEVITCDDEEEAVRKAKSLVNGHDLEVWQGEPYLGRLQSENRELKLP
jgi:hypothetical protein